MMDKAFMPFHQIIRRMLAFDGEIVDQGAGVRSAIYECTIDSPVEFTISRDEDGTLAIGTTPPLYYVDTSLRPSFHRVRFTAFRTLQDDAESR
jgi:hypothetical protein